MMAHEGMEMGGEGFLVPWRVLWPARCPGCSYSWQGLVEARCPECGERVEEGEVVLGGMPSPKQAQAYTHSSWAGDFWSTTISVIIAGTVITWLKGFDISLLCVISGAFLYINGMYWLVWRRRRVTGYPPWVLRFDKRGYRLGVGERMGRVTAWSEKIRFEVIPRRDRVEFRGVRMWGRLTLWNAFEVYAWVTEEQLEGVMERVWAWGEGRVEVRKRRRGWGGRGFSVGGVG